MHQELKPTSRFSALERSLDALKRRGRHRSLAPRIGLDFASNDYLALAGSAELSQAAEKAIARGVPTGAGGSRLLRGNHPEHEKLEAAAAKFFGAQSALYFHGGFSANAAMFATLPKRGDLIVYDELIHASVREGLAATKAETRAVAHNDPCAFEDAITLWRQRPGATGTIWIAVESLYSMDGDQAPLDALDDVASRHDAVLIIDEAHATGVLGPQGRGLSAHLEGRDNVITLHTCGKALGVSGGIVCAPAIVTDYLVNRARAFIYATAPSPLLCAIVSEALQLCRKADDRREQLVTLIEHANNQFSTHFGHTPSGSHIEPVIVGSDTRATAIAARLRNDGFDVRAIRPPTVPEGTSRLRIAITLNVSASDITALADALKDALAREPG